MKGYREVQEKMDLFWWRQRVLHESSLFKPLAEVGIGRIPARSLCVFEGGREREVEDILIGITEKQVGGGNYDLFYWAAIQCFIEIKILYGRKEERSGMNTKIQGSIMSDCQMA